MPSRHAALVAAGMEPASVHLLGRLEGVPALAVGLPEDAPTPEGWHASGLRGYWDRLADDHFALAGRAFQLLEWDRTTASAAPAGRRPSACPGARDALPELRHDGLSAPVARRHRAGRSRRRLLLAQGVRFPAAFYSVLAGFVEPGESLEDTMHREIREEVGIEVTDLRYFGSPALAVPELADDRVHGDLRGRRAARPSRPSCATPAGSAGTRSPSCRGRLSIARRLIDAFVDEKRAAAG